MAPMRMMSVINESGGMAGDYLMIYITALCISMWSILEMAHDIMDFIGFESVT